MPWEPPKGETAADPFATLRIGFAGRVELPTGELLAEQSTRIDGNHDPGPLCWISKEPPSAQLLATLRAESSSNGLWPLLLVDDTELYGDRCTVGVVTPEPRAHIGKWQPGQVMSRIWDGLCQIDSELGPAYDEDSLAPFGHSCPGLAPPGDLLADSTVLANQLTQRLLDEQTRLGLVPVPRGADALTVLGWSGATNHVSRSAGLSAVLRSWEERFGARVLRLGPDRLDLSVAAPPIRAEHAAAVAAEHWTFAPDRIMQDTGSISAYAEEIRGRRQWTFWWD
ncbi:DUF4253 domain-containing protein [Actinopolyspora halophila]|uniref:DUF4253 domain-containing protein n=1 Tax=Actinopolyspora halophila TaxID=1850 RepID=UPI000379DABA|nr:DUF4253 domain-containing protein [Actinopolyspora halophila]